MNCRNSLLRLELIPKKTTYLHAYILQFSKGLLTSFNVLNFCADVKQTADHGKTDSTREKTALFSWMSNMSQGIWFEVPWNPHVSLPGKTKKQLGSGKIDSYIQFSKNKRGLCSRFELEVVNLKSNSFSNISIQNF